MGGADKGLLPWEGGTLVEAAVKRLAPQVDTLLISANRNLARYRALGHPVLPDTLPDFPGPLAGLLAGLRQCTTPLLAAIPCDTPRFPADLVNRLSAAMTAQQAAAAWAITDEGEHPVFLLCRQELAPSLENYLQHGGRRVREWLRQVGGLPVPFPNESAFANFNTAEALAKAENKSRRTRPGED